MQTTDPWMDWTSHLCQLLTNYKSTTWQQLKKKVHQVAGPEKEQLTYYIQFFGGYVRKALLTSLYRECDPSGACKMVAFGSQNMLSDWDVTLIGPSAPEIVSCMMKSFSRYYDAPPSIVFDSNFYCCGFLQAKGIVDTKHVLIVNDQAVVVPIKPEEESTCLLFALLKLIPCFQVVPGLVPPALLAHLIEYKRSLDKSCSF